MNQESTFWNRADSVLVLTLITLTGFLMRKAGFFMQKFGFFAAGAAPKRRGANRVLPHKGK